MVWWSRFLAKGLPAGGASVSDDTGSPWTHLERWYPEALTTGPMARALAGAQAVREGAERRGGNEDTNGMLTSVRFRFAVN
jgi:hypothetical protein